jgi:hypothetical protein
MSPDTPRLAPQAASAAPDETTSQYSLIEADLLARVVVARDLDQRRFTSTPSLWHG